MTSQKYQRKTGTGYKRKNGELKGIDWKWQAADGRQIKAPLARKAVRPNPTDRGKNGGKLLVLVDQNGNPLSIVMEGTNRDDSRLLDEVLEVRVKPSEQT